MHIGPIKEWFTTTMTTKKLATNKHGIQMGHDVWKLYYQSSTGMKSKAGCCWGRHCIHVSTHSKWATDKRETIVQLSQLAAQMRMLTRKPCCRKETARCCKCSFRSKFANNIPYEYKTSHASKATLQSYKHAGAKHNLTQKQDSKWFKVTCLESVEKQWGNK